MCGSIEDATAAQEQSIRLSPRDPNIGNRYWRMGMAFLLQSRIDAAGRLARKGVQCRAGTPLLPIHSRVCPCRQR